MMDDRVAEGLLAIGREIAALEGAGDTGLGVGEYEIFVERRGIEYRVTVQPYWDNATDSPFAAEGDRERVG